MTILDGLKLEWFKYKKNRVVVACLIILLFLLPGIGSVILSINTQGAMFDSHSMLRFPDIWRWMAYMSNWIVFFLLGYIFIYFIATEQDNKTMRQSIINGLTRRQFFSHKLAFIVVISLAYTVYYTIVCLLFGYAMTETAVSPWENSIHILYVFLVSLGYGSIGMLISFIFKRTSISILIYLIYGMFLENVIRHLIHKNIIFNKSMHYYPVNVLEDLTPLPLPDMITETVEGSISGGRSIPLLLTQNEALIGAIVYIVLFIALSYLIFKRRDL